jgi:hypothetical protein
MNPPTTEILAYQPDTRSGDQVAQPFRAVLAAFALSLVPVTAVVLLLAHNAGVKFGFLLLASAVVPGTAALARIELRTLSQTISGVVAVGISISTVGSLGLAWARWFHPLPLAIALSALSMPILAFDLRRRSSGMTRASWLPPVTLPKTPKTRAAMAFTWLPLVLGSAAWGLSLHDIHPGSIGMTGLIGAAPKLWYLSLGLLLAGAVVTTCCRPVRILAPLLYIAALTVVLTGTLPAVVQAPMFDYVYKHIGIIAFLVAHGHLGPTTDIYNRWPGFFAFAAALTKVTGLQPLAYANWAIPLFSALDGLMVAGIAQTITTSRRATALAALLFICSNWIGQTYMSPQAFAFVLYLGAMGLILAKLGRPRGSRLVYWLARPLTGSLRRLRGLFTRSVSGQPILTIVLVLLINFVIAAAHQLTPYALLAQLAICVLLGVAGNYRLLLLVTAISIGYLIANFHFIKANYGIFEGYSLLSSFSVASPGPVAHRPLLYSNAGSALTLLLLLASCLSAIRLVRCGRAQTAVPLLALTAAPIALLLGGDYGGEGALRIFLFSSPWQCLLIAYAVSTLPDRRVIALAGSIILPILTLCVITTLGNVGSEIIPPSEVTAAEYIEQHVPDGSTVMLVGDTFPIRLTPNYIRLLETDPNNQPELFTSVPALLTPSSPTRILSGVLTALGDFGSGPGFLVFSESQYAYARIEGTIPASVIEAVQRTVADSPDFTLWYSNPDTKVYRLR